MRTRTVMVCMGAALAATASPCRGEDDPRGLRVLSHSVIKDEARQKFCFEMVCDRPPDFEMADAQLRPADSFQFCLDTCPGNQGMRGTSPYPWEAIVRGDEIAERGQVAVRDHTRGPSSGASSGGWGPLAGSVPYTVDGGTLRFEIPFSMLGPVSGELRYALEVYRHGSLIDRWEWPGTSPPAPEEAPEAGVPAGPVDNGLIMAFAWPLAAAGVLCCVAGLRARLRRGSESVD